MKEVLLCDSWTEMKKLLHSKMKPSEKALKALSLGNMNVRTCWQWKRGWYCGYMPREQCFLPIYSLLVKIHLNEQFIEVRIVHEEKVIKIPQRRAALTEHWLSITIISKWQDSETLFQVIGLHEEKTLVGSMWQCKTTSSIPADCAGFHGWLEFCLRHSTAMWFGSSH